MAEADHPTGPVDEQALDESVTFTSELIRIDTTNRGDGSCRERPAAEYVAERLADTGLEPALLERTPGRTNVVARIQGTDPSADALLVHGHLDVVPAMEADWSVHPFSGEVRDGVPRGGVLTELLHGPSLGRGQWAGRTRPVTSPSVIRPPPVPGAL